jgi:hypothetical protein
MQRLEELAALGDRIGYTPEEDARSQPVGSAKPGSRSRWTAPAT